MYEMKLKGADAEALLLRTQSADHRELRAADGESGLVRFRTTFSKHERDLQTSMWWVDHRPPYNGVQTVSVPMHYRADTPHMNVWESATLFLFVKDVLDGDLGGAEYIVVFTTRPGGYGHQIWATYTKGVPDVMFDLVVNERFTPKPLVQPTRQPEPASRW